MKLFAKMRPVHFLCGCPVVTATKTVAFYGCFRTDSYLQRDQIKGLDVDLLPCTSSKPVAATTQIGFNTPSCNSLAFSRKCLGGWTE